MDRLPTAYEIVHRQSDNKDKEIERLKSRVDEIDDYDSGLLSDYGGGNVIW